MSEMVEIISEDGMSSLAQYCAGEIGVTYKGPVMAGFGPKGIESLLFYCMEGSFNAVFDGCEIRVFSSDGELKKVLSNAPAHYWAMCGGEPGSAHSPQYQEEISAVSLKNQGNELFRQGDYNGALSAYNEAILADPGYTDAHHNKRLCLLKMGLKDEALRCTEILETLKNSPPQLKEKTVPSGPPEACSKTCMVCGTCLEEHIFTSEGEIVLHDPHKPCDTCGKSWQLHSFRCGHCGESFCWDHVLPFNHYCHGMPSRDPINRYAKVFAIIVGIILIPLGFFLVAGNRSGIFPTFPFAGFITSTGGFLMLGYGLRG
jgi:hypothetical protein